MNSVVAAATSSSALTDLLVAGLEDAFVIWLFQLALLAMLVAISKRRYQMGIIMFVACCVTIWLHPITGFIFCLFAVFITTNTFDVFVPDWELDKKLAAREQAVIERTSKQYAKEMKAVNAKAAKKAAKQAQAEKAAVQ